MEVIWPRSTSLKALMPAESEGSSTRTRCSSADSAETVRHMPDILSGGEPEPDFSLEAGFGDELEAASVFMEADFDEEIHLDLATVGEGGGIVAATGLCEEGQEGESRILDEWAAPPTATGCESEAHWTPGRLLEAAASSPQSHTLREEAWREEARSCNLSLLEVVQAQDQLIAEMVMRYEALEVEAFAMQEQLVMVGGACQKQVPNASWVRGRKSHAAQVAALRVKLAKALAAQAEVSNVCKECGKRLASDLSKCEDRGGSPAHADFRASAPSKVCNQTGTKLKQMGQNSHRRSPRRQTMPCMSHRPAMARSASSGEDSSSRAHIRGKTPQNPTVSKKKVSRSSTQELPTLVYEPSESGIGETSGAIDGYKQSRPDVCAMEAYDLQNRPTKLGVALDGRRIRSWSPPTEGRELSVVESAEVSKRMPQAATAECVGISTQPAGSAQQCNDMVSEGFVPQQTSTPRISLRSPRPPAPARTPSVPWPPKEQPSSCTPPAQVGTFRIFAQYGLSLKSNGPMHVHSHGKVGGGPNSPPCAGIMAASTMSTATNCHEMIGGIPNAPPSARNAASNNTSMALPGCKPTATVMPPVPPTEQAPQQPLPFPACTSFKISAQGHNPFENGVAERSVSPNNLARPAQNAIGVHCGGSLQVVVPCEAVARRHGGSLQVPVPCEIVRGR